jgi:hypothetical protein
MGASVDFNTPEKRSLYEAVRSAWEVDSDRRNRLISAHGSEWGSIGDFCTDLYGIVGSLIEESQARREQLEKIHAAVKSVQSCQFCGGVGARLVTGTTDGLGQNYARTQLCSCLLDLMMVSIPDEAST